MRMYLLLFIPYACVVEVADGAAAAAGLRVVRFWSRGLMPDGSLDWCFAASLVNSRAVGCPNSATC